MCDCARPFTAFIVTIKLPIIFLTSLLAGTVVFLCLHFCVTNYLIMLWLLEQIMFGCKGGIHLKEFLKT